MTHPQQVPAGPSYVPVPVAPSSGKAIASLVLGAASLVAFGLLLGIPAMVLARQARREIRASGGRVGGDGLAQAGFWTGLLGTLWSVLVVLLVVGVFLFGAAVRSSFEATCTADGVATTC